MKHQFKYVNPRAVDEVVGQYAPVNSFSLARIIDEALNNTNLGYVHTEATVGRLMGIPEVSDRLKGVADRMLADNLNRGIRPPWALYDALDFDLVHQTNKFNPAGHVLTKVNAYFYHTEHARPLDQRRVVFHLQHHSIEGTQWSISFPVQIVMKGFPKVNDGYVGYSHGITFLNENDHSPEHQLDYLGVTKRNWLKRMSEHFHEIQTGSNKTFHRAWRQHCGKKDVALLSELIVNNHSYEQIMGWEEMLVDQSMQAGRSLNMIPGGFKGMKLLYQHRLLSHERASIEERDTAIAAYQVINPRAGVPNLIVSNLWKDERYAELVICGADGRLSPEQVRQIRDLDAKGTPIPTIVERVSAKNRLQVERVIASKTYTRIR